MTGRGKGSPLPIVGAVAIAAAALLFLGAWAQAGRAASWAGESPGVYDVICPGSFALPDLDFA